MKSSIMMKPKIAIRGKWVLTWDDDGIAKLLTDYNIFIEDGRIAEISQRPIIKDKYDDVVEMDNSLILPGFINIHSHCMNGAMFRGVPDDYKFGNPWSSRIIYELLIPMGRIVSESLDEVDVKNLIALGMLDLLRSGATTLLDQFSANPDHFFSVADEIGMRVYGAKTFSDAKAVSISPEHELAIDFEQNWQGILDAVIDICRQYDGGEESRIRTVLGPHAADSCSPALLVAVSEAAAKHNWLITTHLAQSPEEMRGIKRVYNKSSVEHLRDCGLLGKRLIAAHCVCASDDDLKILASTGTTVANCAVSFARGGVSAPVWRFMKHGVNTAIGTDSHGMDFISELRTTGFLSKIHEASGQVATAYDLIKAATLAGAEALQRPDLGRISEGSRADILVVDLSRPHLQPVWDPVKNLVWKGGGADISHVYVDGELLVERGTFKRVNEQNIIAGAASAAKKVWKIAEERGFLKSEAV